MAEARHASPRSCAPAVASTSRRFASAALTLLASRRAVWSSSLRLTTVASGDRVASCCRFSRTPVSFANKSTRRSQPDSRCRTKRATSAACRSLPRSRIAPSTRASSSRTPAPLLVGTVRILTDDRHPAACTRCSFRRPGVIGAGNQPRLQLRRAWHVVMDFRRDVCQRDAFVAGKELCRDRAWRGQFVRVLLDRHDSSGAPSRASLRRHLRLRDTRGDQQEEPCGRGSMSRGTPRRDSWPRRTLRNRPSGARLAL